MRKRRILWTVLCGFLLLALVGCAQPAEDRVVAVYMDGFTGAAFTGTVENGVGNGVLRFADWIYEGTFEENGALLAGETDNFPWTLVLVGEEMQGRYAGALETGSPVGRGVFRCDNGAVFTGKIRGMAAEEGCVEALPCSVVWQQVRYTGCYDGPLENGLPNGEGRFAGTSAAGQSLTWEGGWTAGEMTSAGTLSADRLMTPVEGREQMGTYAGQAVNALPEGRGDFSSVDSQGVSYTYTGTWKNGSMDGQGTLTYAAADRFVRTGTFTEGSFTPTWVEALSVLGTGEPRFTLTRAQTDFLSAHPELWEAESRENFYNSEYNAQLDRQYRLRNCLQDPDTMAEPRWLTQYSLKILDVYTGPAFTGGPVITRITATDDSYQLVARIIVPGTVDKVACNRRISFVGVPLQLSTYTTVLGTENTCVIVVAGDVMISG
ncbi:MAG: hypothetical protein IJH47_07400 [Oscillospiraceae bacterium]|nr:hypothetical protein [Oscillospiraceae bacterium]